MIIDGLIPYHIENEELSSIIASTVFFNELKLLRCSKRKLSDIIEKPQYGYTASTSQDPIGIKIVRITDIQGGKVNWDSVPYCECEKPDNYLLKENDILFARTGGTTGKSFIVKGVMPESIFASYLIRVRSKNGINPDFLYWFFQTKQYWSQIVSEKMGSAQPNVNGQKLSTLEIYVPDLSIQNSIAEFLIAYKRKISNASIEIPNLPKILLNAGEKVAILDMLMAKIEITRRERAKAVSDFLILINFYKNTLFSDLYHEFEKSPLSQNAEVAMGQSPAGTSYNELGIGYPLLNGPTEFGDEYPTQIQWTSESTKICKPGDLLICVRGATTGKMNWADKEYCIGRGLAAITSKAERCDKKYLRYFIEFQTQKILSDARGSTFPN